MNAKLKHLQISLIIAGILLGILPLLEIKTQSTETDLANLIIEENLIVLQNNTLLPISDLSKPEVFQKINVIITAYSSSPQETDDDPFITAAGTWVRDGIVANNKYPFGTRIRIPEIYGDKIFVVEDRMNRRKGYYHIDIWFPNRLDALNFGAKRTYIEVLES